MGQLERYGLYVLVVVIFLILGVAIMGGDSDPQAPRGDLAVVSDGGQDLRAFQPVPAATRFEDMFGPGAKEPFTPQPAPAEEGKRFVDAVGDRGGEQEEAPVALDPRPEVPETAPPPATQGVYVVKKGDSYARIAREQYGNEGRWKLIADANSTVGPDDLQPGMKLVIPAFPVEASGTGNVEVVAATTGGTRVHIVQKGEVLGNIAKQHYGRASEWRRIAEANPEVDPTRMLPGTRLRIPQLD